ncbi:MAG: hypothetical protein ABIG60_01225 [Patescibacteria group bacterium]
MADEKEKEEKEERKNDVAKAEYLDYLRSMAISESLQDPAWS